MATYYVRTTGSDAAAGTTPATAWLTIGKAMGTAGAADGDTVYVGAGTYRVTSTIAPATHAAMTYLYGDTDGSKTGDAGEVVVTNYGTSDSAAATSVSVFTFASKSYWTLGKLTIVDGAGVFGTSGPILVSGNSSNLTFEDLTLAGKFHGLILTSLTFGTNHSITMRRCRAVAVADNFYASLPTSATGADNNVNVTIENCALLGPNNNLRIVVSGTATYKSGGITVKNCLMFSGNGSGFNVNASSVHMSQTHKLVIYNCLLYGPYGITGRTDTVTENYNLLWNTDGARTNVTAGANSVSNLSYNWRFSFGHEASWGGVTRPFGELVAGSPLLTWGGTVVPTDDINGVTRPASGAGQTTTQQALGPFERGNSATRETTTTRTGGTAIKITGPGYHDFELAVSPVSTSVSVWSYKDNAYGTAATAPQLIITNAGEAGYGGTTITSTGGTGTWAAMTATFTPTSAGIVTVRLQSNATVGTAVAYFDDFSVS